MMFFVKTGATDPNRFVEAHVVLKDGPPARCLVAKYVSAGVSEPR